MKQKITLFGLAVFAFSFNQLNAQFVDLSTGKSINVVKHEGNGMMFNTETQRPVHFYINTETKDTIYGRTGEIVNGRLTKLATGGYAYNDDAMYVFKQGEFRLKSEADSAGYKKVFQRDGDVKVKYGDYKRKEDLDGDVKIKDGEAKAKLEEDGTLKVKKEDYKAKRDEDGNLLIKDKNAKLKVGVDGSVKAKDKTTNYKGKVDPKDRKIKEKNGQTNSKTKIKEDKLKVKKDGEVEVKVDAD